MNCLQLSLNINSNGPFNYPNAPCLTVLARANRCGGTGCFDAVCTLRVLRRRRGTCCRNIPRSKRVEFLTRHNPNPHFSPFPYNNPTVHQPSIQHPHPPNGQGKPWPVSTPSGRPAATASPSHGGTPEWKRGGLTHVSIHRLLFSLCPTLLSQSSKMKYLRCSATPLDRLFASPLHSPMAHHSSHDGR